MVDTVSEDVNEGLVFAGHIPLASRRIEELPGATEMAFVNEKNEHTLRASLLSTEPVEGDEHDEVLLHLKRQELKIDLLMDMMGEILAQHSDIPVEQWVRLRTAGVQWQEAAKPLSVGDKLEINLFVTPPIPRPLTFFAVIEAIDNSLVSASFQGVNQAVQDSLDKIIFRHHRRTVAQSRLQD